MMRLIDLRADGGPIEVFDDTDTRLAYAVHANGGEQWVVWVRETGPTDWSHVIHPDSDAALKVLAVMVDRDNRAGAWADFEDGGQW